MTLISSVYIATSLDGYIARKGGELDWLDAASATVTEGEDCGYQAFMDSVDLLVMGRKTFEQILSFDEWPYGEKQLLILSSKKMKIPDELTNTVSHSSETPQEICDCLSSEGKKRLYIDGGNTIQRFLAAGLINDITITIIPVILGSGISLFANLESDIPLKHIATESYDFGFVQVTYEVKKPTI